MEVCLKAFDLSNKIFVVLDYCHRLAVFRILEPLSLSNNDMGFEALNLGR